MPEDSEIPVEGSGSVEPAKLGCNGCARILILKVQSHQRRETEAQSVAVGLREGRAQKLVEQKAGFEFRTGQSVFDRPNAITQVQYPRAPFHRTKQTV